jgi:hypothetical protein
MQLNLEIELVDYWLFVIDTAGGCRLRGEPDPRIAASA